MIPSIRIYRGEDTQIFLASVLIMLLVSFPFAYWRQAHALTLTLAVTINNSLTFTSSSNNFTTITPGTAVYATTTLSMVTNDNSGWNVVLSGDNKSTGNSNFQRTGDTTVQIPDQTEWIPGAATTTAGNSVALGSLDSSGNVLAFRVMSASSTNGVAFLAPSWWGANDAGGALWAGVASSTASRQIGNAGVGSFSATAHLNTVNYYLNVPSTQKTGAYTAPITITATGNP